MFNFALVGCGGMANWHAQQLQKIIRDQSIDVMVIGVPARAAQKVLNQIMSAGIKAVLNFAPASLNSRRGVKVKTVDLTTSLESLSYFLAQPEAGVITSSQRRSQPSDIDESKERQL